MTDTGIIAIGRNEGERLRRCLASVAGGGGTVVYVDSSSADGSAELARSMGATVAVLDGSLPCSAARARNAGFERLMRIDQTIRFVQFVDGDCELVPGWIERARAELESRPEIAVVCGRRREQFPQRSVYNRLADLEWDTPVGEARSCGGDAMVRAAAFSAVGGFDSSVVAGEEPELCQRLRDGGWKILRLDAEMTRHDSAMLRLSQWWRRAVRSGYGALDVATRFSRGRGADGLFVRQLRSARAWAVGWPLATAIAGAMGAGVAGRGTGIAAALVVALLLPLQVLRLAMRARRRVHSWQDAAAYGALTMLGKWANLSGQLRYVPDRVARRRLRLIEYKVSSFLTSPGLRGEREGSGS